MMEETSEHRTTDDANSDANADATVAGKKKIGANSNATEEVDADRKLVSEWTLAEREEAIFPVAFGC